jgi:hypothetical protein
MSLLRTPAWLALLVGAATSVAIAQPNTVATRPYRSAFEGYRPYKDEPLLPWRQANDTVGRIGGWQAYAREAQGAAAPAPQASSPSAASAPATGHGDHRGHKGP